MTKLKCNHVWIFGGSFNKDIQHHWCKKCKVFRETKEINTRFGHPAVQKRYYKDTKIYYTKIEIIGFKTKK